MIKFEQYFFGFFLILCFFVTGCNEKQSLAKEATVLTLAVFESDAQLSRSKLVEWVNLYNEKHPDVKIEVVNYLDDYLDPYEALDHIKIEINAGKGPDLINFGGNYSPIEISNGMVDDLYPLMQNDESFEKQDFYDNIIDSFAVGNQLNILVPSYRIASYATIDNELSRLERMDIEELIDAYNGMTPGNILFPGETKKAVFGKICYLGMENYVDWDKGICHFNEESFKEVLLFANQFPVDLKIPKDYSAKSFFTEGRALLYPVSIDNVYGITSVRMLYGDMPTYIGYPLDSGNGNLAEIVDIAVGISATSKNKEEAWGFLKSLLDSEFQDNIKSALPVRINSLEQKLKDAMKVEYDSNGNKVEKERLIFEGEDPVYIYEISKEDAEVLQSVIRNVEFSATVDPTIYSIMLEEADYLFNDDRNVDDVADMIQNRASLYISEKK